MKGGIIKQIKISKTKKNIGDGEDGQIRNVRKNIERVK